MKLIATQAHQGEEIFPLFKQGTVVTLKAECQYYQNWFSCEIEGYETYIPIHFIEQNKLVRDYNPTELVIDENEIVELLELHYQWAIVKKDNQVGWLPCEILKSR